MALRHPPLGKEDEDESRENPDQKAQRDPDGGARNTRFCGADHDTFTLTFHGWQVNTSNVGTASTAWYRCSMTLRSTSTAHLLASRPGMSLPRLRGQVPATSRARQRTSSRIPRVPTDRSSSDVAGG